MPAALSAPSTLTAITPTCSSTSPVVAVARNDWMMPPSALLTGTCHGASSPGVGTAMRLSGIEIGYELAFELHDQILEHQLAFLEAFELQLIDMNIHRQALDDLVQVAMFDTQLPQFLDIAEQVAVDVVFLIAHSFDRPVTLGRLAFAAGALALRAAFSP